MGNRKTDRLLIIMERTYVLCPDTFVLFVHANHIELVQNKSVIHMNCHDVYEIADRWDDILDLLETENQYIQLESGLSFKTVEQDVCVLKHDECIYFSFHTMSQFMERVKWISWFV